MLRSKGELAEEEEEEEEEVLIEYSYMSKGKGQQLVSVCSWIIQTRVDAKIMMV